MREGINPAKLTELHSSAGAVRAIVPVFIPSADGYFSEALPILGLCLDSLSATVPEGLQITVVANGCSRSVLDNLSDRIDAGTIDQLIVERQNIGKADAALIGIRATSEDLVLVTDGDVLFRMGWLEQALTLLTAFPRCGLLGLAPAPNLATYATATTIIEAAMSQCLIRADIIDWDDFEQFARSIDRPELVARRYEQLVVRARGETAVVGAGHFCYITQRQVAQAYRRGLSRDAYGERSWIDIPTDRAGYWRLSMTQAYGLHMGNRLEPWMQASQPKTSPTPASQTPTSTVAPSFLRHVPYRLRCLAGEWIASRLLRRPER